MNVSTATTTNGARPADNGAAPQRQYRIYTKFGDAGQTMLLGKVKVWKDDPRIEVYGTLDEATSALGLARATTRYNDICRDVLDLQGELIGVMTELATPPEVTPVIPPLVEAQVERLERRIDAYEEERIQTRAFVRPGGSPASASLDLARAMVRRAERGLVTLSRQTNVNPALLRYLNRLSDLLYVMARVDEQREIKRLVQRTLASAQEGVSNTQMNAQTGLSLTICDRLIEAGIRRAEEIGVPMVLAVVDASGQLLELRRMDNALLVSVSLAPNKAYTAAVARMPTADLARLAQPGESLYGIDVNLPHLTLLGGGIPIVVNGTVVGAVGASGGAIDQDITVAQAMVEAYQTAVSGH